jgi:putative radical SAM enzyme (TIGR03279 family)
VAGRVPRCFFISVKGGLFVRSVIKSVEPGSPLRHKVHAGDRLISINGHDIIDVLDYKFHGYDERVVVEVETPEGHRKKVRAKKAEGQDLGLEFETYLMDKAHSCANNCVFCFVDQTPPGMRPTLYFKDDDARLSFLMGNYITLTNLSEREVQRICDLHVSPVNVSVHTTDPVLREKLLGNRFAGRGLEIMNRFAEAGIVMNCQIVCCPGLNDGEALSRTMRDLAELYPQVESVAIVPVGLTKHREGLTPLTAFNRQTAGETIDRVTAFGDECAKKCGARIFFCSDELYLKAERELPPDEFYENYPQLENGVGMLRLQEAEFHAALKLMDKADGVPFSIATGCAAAPFLKKLLDDAASRDSSINGRVYAIENDFFGHTIDVAGLITGQDLIAQLRGKDLGERLLISENMLRRDEQDFLDDVTREQASEALGVPIYPVSSDGFDLAEAMFGTLPEIPVPKRGEQTEYNKYNHKS